MEDGTRKKAARAAARPRFPPSQLFNCMARFYYPMDTCCQPVEVSTGQFHLIPHGYQILPMQTVFETRRKRLRMLIEKHGSIAALNVAIGWEATNPRLSQIQNASIRSDRGTPYEMGESTARTIEAKLKLEHGFMDTPTIDDLELDPKIVHLVHIAQQLREAGQEHKIDQAIKIIDTLAEPEPPLKNGTHHS